jgi:hypothetical protein
VGQLPPRSHEERAADVHGIILVGLALPDGRVRELLGNERVHELEAKGALETAFGEEGVMSTGRLATDEAYARRQCVEEY